MGQIKFLGGKGGGVFGNALHVPEYYNNIRSLIDQHGQSAQSKERNEKMMAKYREKESDFAKIANF